MMRGYDGKALQKAVADVSLALILIISTYSIIFLWSWRPDALPIFVKLLGFIVPTHLMFRDAQLENWPFLKFFLRLVAYWCLFVLTVVL